MLDLDASGAHVALGLFQVLTYPSGWTTPHNPHSEAPTIGKYRCPGQRRGQVQEMAEKVAESAEELAIRAHAIAKQVAPKPVRKQVR